MMPRAILLALCAVLLAACSPPPRAGEADLPAAQAAAEPLPTPPLDFEIAPLTPETIRAAVARYGAVAVVQELYGERRDNGFGVVITHMAAGEAEWLALVPLLENRVTTHPMEALDEAMSEALPRNAAAVLRLMSSGVSAQSACQMRVIDPTEADIVAYYSAAIPAVEAVTDPALQGARAECLVALQTSREEARRFVSQ